MAHSRRARNGSRLERPIGDFGWREDVLDTFNLAGGCDMTLTNSVGATREEWDGHKEVRRLISKTEELCELYKRLGYSPRVEENARSWLDELNDMEVSIPDFEQFQRLLDEEKASEERLGGRRIFAEYYELYDEILNCRTDKNQVLSLLNKDLKKTLPYICASGVVCKPRNPEKFSTRLSWLEGLFGRTQVPQSKEAREELLAKITKVREDSQKENTELQSAVKELDEAIRWAWFKDGECAFNEKVRQLDDLLWSLVYVRHENKPSDPYFTDGLAKEIKGYLDSTWMHTPWLTKAAVQHLLEGDIAKLYPYPGLDWNEPAWHFKWVLVCSTVVVGSLLLLWYALQNWPIGRWPSYLLAACAAIIAWFFFTLDLYGVSWLRQYERARRTSTPLVQILSEVAKGSYHGPELARRLRDLEHKGICVHSLALALLELPQATPAKETPAPPKSGEDG
jgi:hypothetical protein